MASYLGTAKNANGKISERRKPWRARVRENWTENFLGYYATKEEAERVEEEFKNGRN